MYALFVYASKKISLSRRINLNQRCGNTCVSGVDFTDWLRATCWDVQWVRLQWGEASLVVSISSNVFSLLSWSIDARILTQVSSNSIDHGLMIERNEHPPASWMSSKSQTKPSLVVLLCLPTKGISHVSLSLGHQIIQYDVIEWIIKRKEQNHTK